MPNLLNDEMRGKMDLIFESAPISQVRHGLTGRGGKKSNIRINGSRCVWEREREFLHLSMFCRGTRREHPRTDELHCTVLTSM